MTRSPLESSLYGTTNLTDYCRDRFGTEPTFSSCLPRGSSTRQRFRGSSKPSGQCSHPTKSKTRTRPGRDRRAHPVARAAVRARPCVDAGWSEEVLADPPRDAHQGADRDRSDEDRPQAHGITEVERRDDEGSPRRPNGGHHTAADRLDDDRDRKRAPRDDRPAPPPDAPGAPLR